MPFYLYDIILSLKIKRLPLVLLSNAPETRFIFQFKVFHQFFYRPPSSDIKLRNFDPPPQSSGIAQRNLLMKLDIQLPIPILVRAHNGV